MKIGCSLPIIDIISFSNLSVNYLHLSKRSTFNYHVYATGFHEKLLLRRCKVHITKMQQTLERNFIWQPHNLSNGKGLQ